MLREGNSDRRAADSVKQYARKHPHSMGAWTPDSKTNVATMGEHDFKSNEKSVVIERDDTLRIEHEAADGTVTVLKESVPVLAGEIVDATVMQVAHLHAFLANADRPGQGRGRAVLGPPQGHDDEGLRPDHLRPRRHGVLPRGLRSGTASSSRPRGSAPTTASAASWPVSTRLADGAEIKAAFEAAIAAGPALAMVDSDRGITNLHVPSDVIVDASMPAMIRTSGHMWGPDGQEADTLAVIPDSSYAGIYQVVIDDCRAHGAFDPTTMGSVPNVGLMAQAAEEYGSHDKTFEIAAAGTVRVVDAAGDVLIEHDVEAGDIWRACQTKDVPVRDWVKLAVTRARATGAPAVFWLDETRAHDANLIAKVRAYLPEHDTDGLEIQILAPELAIAFSLERIRKGEDTISVTGNVLRDYLTDLFPILELGTSAKMLSIVPLINGGGLFETGAGGSAPKHVQQLVKENYLRWDSLGEFLALAESFAKYAAVHDNPHAKVLGETLDRATGTFLNENKNPARRVGSIDNRGTHFYLALYWAQELAAQNDDPELAAAFAGLAETLAAAGVDDHRGADRGAGPPGRPRRLLPPRRRLATAVMRPSRPSTTALASLADPSASREFAIGGAAPSHWVSMTTQATTTPTGPHRALRAGGAGARHGRVRDRHHRVHGHGAAAPGRRRRRRVDPARPAT